jgi:hypothetical protein
MEIRQLELDLWQSLEAATRYPETANLRRLCDALEGAIRYQPLQEQLQVAGEMLRQISEVYAARAEWMMSGWEHRHNPQEPVVDLEGYGELFAQSLSLDLGELFEEPDAVVYPSDRKGRPLAGISKSAGSGGSVVGLLDKESLLAELDQRLEEHPEMTEAEAFETAIAVAHGEDVSAWTGAIAQVLQQEESQALSLLEVQARSGMPLVAMWLGGLLGGYRLEQRGEFYQRETIWLGAVTLPVLEEQ